MLKITVILLVLLPLITCQYIDDYDDGQYIVAPRRVIRRRPQVLAIRGGGVRRIVQPRVAVVRQPAVAVVRQQPVAIAPPVVRTQVLEEQYAPQPYNYGYSWSNEEGATVSRQEDSDGNTVRGSYSYVDAQGLTRTVEYIADENGFRATVRTNEPGTANSSPANAEFLAEEPPAQVVQQWINPPQRRVAGGIVN